MDDDAPAVVQRAKDAYEAVRTINHLTYAATPAPDAYTVLGNLASIGFALPQACRQLAVGLLRSLDEYDVYEDDGAVPAARVDESRRSSRRGRRRSTPARHGSAASPGCDCPPGLQRSHRRSAGPPGQCPA